MRRFVLATVAAVAMVSPLTGQGPEFEVVSLKRNTAGPLAGGLPTSLRGRITMTNVPVLTLLARAYSKVSLPIEIVGLPGWARSDRFDVATGRSRCDARPTRGDVAGDAGRSHEGRRTLRNPGAAELQPGVDPSRWKTGPELKPSTADCPPPAPSQPPSRPSPALFAAMASGPTMTLEAEKELMSLCRFTMNIGNTTYAGGAEMISLVRSIQLTGGVREAIGNKTGLTGLYTFKLTFSSPALAGAPTTDDAPSIFTALQEQLGLKLEPTTQQAQVIVGDHIEPPTEN